MVTVDSQPIILIKENHISLLSPLSFLCPPSSPPQFHRKFLLVSQEVRTSSHRNRALNFVGIDLASPIGDQTFISSSLCDSISLSQTLSLDLSPLFGLSPKFSHSLCIGSQRREEGIEGSGR
jgi:hypothetical protein